MFDLRGFGDQLLLGALMTVGLSLSILVLGLVIGLFIATAKLSGFKPFRAVGEVYTAIFRAVPELLIILIIYFGSSGILTAIAESFGYDEFVELSPFAAGVTSLGLVFGAYASEVFRGAILAIPKGQIEAARAYGMNGWLVFRRVVLPQIWRVALPGLGNLFLVTQKDTALVSVIGLVELTRAAAIATGFTKAPFTFYFVASLLYLAMTSVTMYGQRHAERWARRGQPGLGS